jgi:hypothetical protein
MREGWMTVCTDAVTQVGSAWTAMEAYEISGGGGGGGGDAEMVRLQLLYHSKDD